MSDLLLPCPFCGQKAYIRKRHHPRDPTYSAYCDDCGCGTSDLYRQPALAIQAWNQRALAEIEPAPSDGGGAVSDLVERKDEEREAALRCQGDWHPAGDHAVLLRLLNRERARITELEGELAKLSLPGGLTVNCLRLRTCSERAKLEGERDTATRTLGEIATHCEKQQVRSGLTWYIAKTARAGLSKTETIT